MLKAEDFYDFEDGKLKDWQAAGSTATITAKRYKNGQNSLLWSWQQPGAVLRGKFQKHTVSANSAFGLWLHNPSPVDGRLYVTFFNGPEKIAEVWYNLNFQGWRPLGVNFNKIGIINGTVFDTVEIKAPAALSAGELYLDSVHTFVIAPGLSPDHQQPWINNQSLLKQPPEKTFYSTHDIAQNRPYLPALTDVPENTAAELNNLAEYYQKHLFYADRGQYRSMDELEKSFEALRIREQDGVITGLPIVFGNNKLFLKNAETLDFKAKFLVVLKSVVEAYQKETGKNQQRAEEMFVQMCRHLLDQGFQEGNGNLGWIGNGYGYRHYPPQIFRMKAVLDKHDLTEAMAKNVAWFSNGDKMLTESPRVSCDELYNYSPHLPGAVLMTPDLAERYQRMKALHNFYEKIILAPLPFGDDGSIHHHGGHHLGYGGYAPPMLVNSQILPLKDSEFRISPVVQEKLRKYTRAINFQNTYGICAPNLYMRSGTIIQLSAEAMAGAMAKLDDPEMAGIYLWALNGKSTPDAEKYRAAGIKPLRPEGHLTMNLAAIGMHRRDDWTISTVGLLKTYRNLEIYGWLESNNYGRNSRNGSVFVTNHDDCGYLFEGWDWNYWPGATSVVRPPVELFEGYSFYGNRSDFAGGATLSDNGVWGMDYQGADAAFRKSVFFFDNRVTVMTTDIEKGTPRPANSPGGKAITTLFQQGAADDLKPIAVNGENITQFPYTAELDGKSINTLVDGLGNGYYIWPGSAVSVQRRAQEWTYFFKKYLKDPKDNPCINMQKKQFRETPLEDNAKYYNPTQGNFNLAYIDHGDAPKGASCIYTLLPASGSDGLRQFTGAMKSATPPVKILYQNKDVHAVYDPALQATGYVVYNHRTRLDNGGPLISTSAPAFIMIKDHGDRYEISVASSDPEQSGTFSLRLQGLSKSVKIKSAYPNSAVIEITKNQ